MYNYLNMNICVYECIAFSMELDTPKICLNTVANITVGTSGCHTGKGCAMSVSQGLYQTCGLFHLQTKCGISWVEDVCRPGLFSAPSHRGLVLEVRLSPQTFHRQAVKVASRALQSNVSNQDGALQDLSRAFGSLP